MKRYHPLLVALHWLLAALILGGLVMGRFVLAATPNSDPAKMFSLKMHMSIGLVILVLMLIRLIVRLRSEKPPHAETGNGLMDTLGRLTHWGFYLLVLAMCASGIAIARLAGLPDIVFGGSGAPLPVDFSEFAPRGAHGVIAKILGGLILLHVAGFLYHQFALKDGLFKRMWFGDRT